jgi:hypothetical protein
MPKQGPKKVAAKLQRLIDAWGTVRPAKTFAGMTLEQFKAKVQPSLTARDQLKNLRTQTTDSQVQRQHSDAASLEAVLLVVNAVKGDPDEGENGSLYTTMGYIPKNQRRSGLTRKGQTATPVATTATNAVPAK